MDIVKPSENFRVTRLCMQKLMQNDSERIDDYVSRLKLQANKCALRDDDELQARAIEQMIAGTRHVDLQNDLLQKQQALTLEQALDMGRTSEASLAHVKDLAEPRTAGATSGATATIDAVRKKQQMCMRCGGTPHANPEQCPATGSVCHYCQKPNHWVRVCRAKSSKRQPKPKDDEKGADYRKKLGQAKEQGSSKGCLNSDCLNQKKA